MYQLNRLIDHINTQNRFLKPVGVNSYRLLCPECQVGSKDEKGKTYTSGNGKGYIYKTTTKSYEYWSFHCKRNSCPRNVAIRLDRFIQHYYPELYSGIDESSLNQVVKHSGHSGCFSKDTIEDNIDQLKPVVQKLPRSSPQQQAGKGGWIDQKIKRQKEANKKWYERKIPPVL